MKVRRLRPKVVQKPWGRIDLPACFGAPANGAPIGEIWYEDPEGPDRPLLVKYLFTSEKLSIQVHPDDARAKSAGHASGKDEAWVVLAADPGAVIGLGLRESVSRDELRRSALDGRIADLVDWRPSAAGDFYYSPAGTVHALGQGLTVVEVQQNVDLTYRLYDYGRPRELHLEEGVAAARPEPYAGSNAGFVAAPGRTVLAEGAAFVLERWTCPAAGRLRAGDGVPVWVIPVSGAGSVGGTALEAGGVWLIEGAAELSLAEGSDVLVAYPGATWRPDLLD